MAYVYDLNKWLGHLVPSGKSELSGHSKRHEISVVYVNDCITVPRSVPGLVTQRLLTGQDGKR